MELFPEEGGYTKYRFYLLGGKVGLEMQHSSRSLESRTDPENREFPRSLYSQCHPWTSSERTLGPCREGGTSGPPQTRRVGSEAPLQHSLQLTPMHTRAGRTALQQSGWTGSAVKTEAERETVWDRKWEAATNKSPVIDFFFFF